MTENSSARVPSSLGFTWFDDMIGRSLAYARSAREAGRRVVGIMCEYTPREIILAAGGAPVCLCGGSAEMVTPAEEHLPANLCPLIKSTFGYHVTRSNPFLEMADLVVAETTCDGKKKMYELMGQTRPMYVLELPQKSGDPDALSHWTSELHKLRRFLERRWSVQVSDERLREAIRQCNRYRLLRRRLADLMASPAPRLTGRQMLDANCQIWPTPDELARLESAIAAGAALPPRPELAKRVRVLLTGVPVPHGAHRVIDIIESTGGLVVCMENCSGLKPMLDDVDESAAAADPIAALAQKYFQIPCSVLTPNQRRLDNLAGLARQLRAQCVVELVWQACLTYDVESAQVKRFVEADLHLPYLRICTDYSPNDSARIALRIEAMFEMVRSLGGQ